MSKEEDLGGAPPRALSRLIEPVMDDAGDVDPGPADQGSAEPRNRAEVRDRVLGNVNECAFYLDDELAQKTAATVFQALRLERVASQFG